MAKDSTLPPGVRLSRSGKYQIRYTGPDGLRYSGGTYRTKTDAKQALSVIQASISDRSWKKKKASLDGELSSKSTLSEWSEEWIRTRVSKSTGEPLATLTVKGYRTIIGSSLASFDRSIESITSSQIRKWWTAYRVDYPRGANSAYKYLNSLLSYAVKRRAIVENPCDIDGASHWVAKPKPQLSSKDSIDRLIQETENPWKAFFAVAIFGGLRRGEISELRVGDVIRDPVSPARLGVDIRRSVKWLTNSETEVGRPKSVTSARFLWLGPTASSVLGEYMASRPAAEDALLFSRDAAGRIHLLESTIRNEVKKARERFGISESLHRLRDYALTLYAQTGATLQELMTRGGHSNVRAAMAYQRDAGRDAELAERMR